jgi:hypothetical protein
LDFAVTATPDEMRQLLRDYGQRGREVHEWFVLFGFLFGMIGFMTVAVVVLGALSIVRRNGGTSGKQGTAI